MLKSASTIYLFEVFLINPIFWICNWTLKVLTVFINVTCIRNKINELVGIKLPFHLFETFDKKNNSIKLCWLELIMLFVTKMTEARERMQALSGFSALSQLFYAYFLCGISLNILIKNTKNMEKMCILIHQQINAI